MKILDSAFFERDSHTVAKELLGQFLCREIDGQVLKYSISEIEIYDGFEDRASHAFGKTSNVGRSQIMFGPAGVWYVYLCYGIHWMLNVVTREKGYPAALLIRGCKEVSGPGRLSKVLGIGKDMNGKSVLPESHLWIEKTSLKQIKIEASPRIGIQYAGEHWAKQPLRFSASF